MRLPIFVAAALVASASLSARADDIAYHVALTAGPASAVGTITTDGAIGTLSGGDILTYTLTVSDAVNSESFTSGAARVIGNDLTATSSGLFFNFGDTGYAGLAFSDASLAYEVCVASQGASCPGAAGSIGILVNGTDNVSGTLAGVGQIGATATTPEPSSIALLGSGVLGLAGTVRRRLVQRLQSA